MVNVIKELNGHVCTFKGSFLLCFLHGQLLSCISFWKQNVRERVAVYSLRDFVFVLSFFIFLNLNLKKKMLLW